MELDMLDMKGRRNGEYMDQKKNLTKYLLLSHSKYLEKQGQTVHMLQIANFWDIYIYI